MGWSRMLFHAMLMVVGSALVQTPIHRSPVRMTAIHPFRFAPPMTLEKHITMQQKRVRIYIRYSGGDRYAAKVFSRVKQLVGQRFPDVVVEKRIRNVRSSRDTGIFEILVDDRLVYAKPPERDGIFLSMRALNVAIVRARRLRRPGQTVYGDPLSFSQPSYAHHQE